MKKFLLLIFFAVITVTAAQAQKHWTVGLNGGVPIGDAESLYNFHLNADVAYRIDIIKLLDIGAVVGYSHYFGDSEETNFGNIEVEDLQFLPIAATGRLRILSILFLGTDLGYAVGLSNDTDGGFYIRPQIGLNLGIVNILASYSNISIDGGSIEALNAGIEIKL